MELLFSGGKPSINLVMKSMLKLRGAALVLLLASALRESLDRVILSLVDENLVPARNALGELGYSPESSRKLIERGKIIAVKEKNTWYTAKGLLSEFLSRLKP